MLGGIYVHRVVGASPVIVVLGLLVAEPPEIFDVVPGPDVPSSLQTVTKVNTVVEVAVAWVRIKLVEYGETASFSWNMVVGVPVRLYQPVVVASVVCVPPVPPIRVVPV